MVSLVMVMFDELVDELATRPSTGPSGASPDCNGPRASRVTVRLGELTLGGGQGTMDQVRVSADLIEPLSQSLDLASRIHEHQPLAPWMKVCNDVCGVVYVPDPVEGEFRFVLRSPWMNNFPGPLTATFEPTQDLVGISDRCRESDTLKITPRKPGQSFEYRGQVRAPVVIGERMDLVDDDSLQPRKELPRRNSGAHEHGFDGL